ncbi:YybH family protein [Chitinophaga filiformis]|uniref:Ketosteroid isomerase homolog n=1 Tax=Chitinophaga filiformis TaxID=104663 RepID=A0A1G7JL74_CHIFI|nr:nuclear transport factor 2 family protein [Chitinophaga filiformis]SDF25646.1 Ketosteroid isomerase homolog [Chitinophaga filiformis]
MRLLLFLILLAAPFAAVRAQQPQSAIRALLQKQTSSWNQGDLDAFMTTYWQSDSLIFIGKRGPTYGWQATLDNYKKSYPDTTAMGKLAFNILELKPLASDVYFVVGKWHLQRTIGDLEGHFSLIIKRIKGSWKIIADHSS